MGGGRGRSVDLSVKYREQRKKCTATRVYWQVGHLGSALHKLLQRLHCVMSGISVQS